MAGIKIYGKGGRQVDVTPDNKLKVESQVTFARYSPRFATNKTETILSDVIFIDLFNINFTGKFDSMSLRFDREDIQVQIEVDSLLIFDESLKSIKDSYNLEEDEEELVSFPIKVCKDAKQLFLNYKESVDISTNITIRAKTNKISTTKFKSGILMYREEV